MVTIPFMCASTCHLKPDPYSTGVGLLEDTAVCRAYISIPRHDGVGVAVFSYGGFGGWGGEYPIMPVSVCGGACLGLDDVSSNVIGCWFIHGLCGGVLLSCFCSASYCNASAAPSSHLPIFPANTRRLPT